MKKLNRLAKRNKVDLIEILHTWARYRLDPHYNSGWPRQVTLGKLLDGMPGTDCPRCKDALTGASVGFIHVDAEGLAKQKVTCPVCEGARKIKLDYCPSKANPILISGNGNRYGWNDDPVSQKVDLIICIVMSELQKLVIIQEFTRNGTQNDKIRRLAKTPGIIRMTHSIYNETLEEALAVVEENL